MKVRVPLLVICFVVQGLVDMAVECGKGKRLRIRPWSSKPGARRAGALPSPDGLSVRKLLVSGTPGSLEYRLFKGEQRALVLFQNYCPHSTPAARSRGDFSGWRLLSLLGLLEGKASVEPEKWALRV